MRTDLAASKRRKHKRKGSQELFEVNWEEDAAVKKCGLCRADFSLARRKHHCRHCGRVMCSDCSAFLFFEFSKRKHRVCVACNNQLLQEQEAFERDTVTPGSNLFEDSSDEERAVPVTPASDAGEARDTLYATLVNAITPKHDEKARRKQAKKERKERRKREKQERKLGAAPTKEVQSIEHEEKIPDHQAALFNAEDDAWFTDVPEQSVRTGDDHLDKSMTLDELEASGDERHKFTPAVPHATTPVNTTFYDDDVDKLVVDDSPGYFEATVAERAAEKKKEEQRQQQMASDLAWVNSAAQPPTVMTQRISSEQESYSLVDPPSHTSTSPVEKKQDAPTTKDVNGKKGGFAGALKRFFGMGSKTAEKAKTPPKATTALATSAAAPPQKTEEEGSVAASTSRHQSSNDLLAPAADSEYLARHTVVDYYGPTREGSSASDRFRYTMAGYTDASSAATKMDPLDTRQFNGAATVYDNEPKFQQQQREHNPKRRGTFDGLFDSPKNNLAASDTGRYATDRKSVV